MAHAFKTISAKPTFGTLKENLYQSDYINRKKGAIAFCNSPCRKTRFTKCNILPINKSNLISGQYTKSNLNNICTVSIIDPLVKPVPCGNDTPSIPCDPCQNNTPIAIDPASNIPFYYTYQIDPLGELFGKTQCGELNYTHYMSFNS